MDKSGLKGYRTYLEFIYNEIMVQKEGFRFGKVRVWFDSKQPCFELI